MDITVPPHDTCIATPHSKSETGLSWSAFFQALGREESAKTPYAKLPPVSRFSTSA